jgi:hypothetical protein
MLAIAVEYVYFLISAVVIICAMVEEKLDDIDDDDMDGRHDQIYDDDYLLQLLGYKTDKISAS